MQTKCRLNSGKHCYWWKQMHARYSICWKLVLLEWTSCEPRPVVSISYRINMLKLDRGIKSIQTHPEGFITFWSTEIIIFILQFSPIFLERRTFFPLLCGSDLKIQHYIFILSHSRYLDCFFKNIIQQDSFISKSLEWRVLPTAFIKLLCSVF